MLYCYNLFDRYIFSSCELKLLHRVNHDIEPGHQDVRIEWSCDQVLPEGTLCAGNESWGIFVLRAGEGFWAVLPRTGFVVWVPKSGTRLTVYYDRSQLTDREEMVLPLRDVTNSLVTGLLSRLPMMWGALPLHAAMLHAPEGSIMLAGPSGVGKSTLSQQLVRRHGWRLLDDDACMASIVDGELKVTPMGGMARLRADAANRLQLSGPLLSGYAGGKVMVQAIQSALLEPERKPVIALFHLSLDNECLTTRIPGGYLSRLDTVNAVAQASATALSLDQESIPWRTNQFYVAAQFGKIANYSLSYNHTQTPEEVADDIAKIYAESY